MQATLGQPTQSHPDMPRVPIGGGNHGLYALLKLDGVLKPPIWWLS